MSDILKLFERARLIGVDRIAFPIDVFAIATEISEHPHAMDSLPQLTSLLSDPENYFTRWAAARAINQLGTDAISVARPELETQLEREDYPLAASEIRNALDKLANA